MEAQTKKLTRLTSIDAFKTLLVNSMTSADNQSIECDWHFR